MTMTYEEYKKKQKEERRKIAVPIFFKRKIFMVMILLICSAIMVGMASYAWFLLSTAPELTGVSTTVAANGSLEIALLNNSTGEDPTRVTGAIGESSSVIGVVKSNLTWGNVVDLSDASYGLQTIVLNPASINLTETDDGKTILDTAAPVSFAHNGLDGRLTKLDSNVSSSSFDGSAFMTKVAVGEGAAATYEDVHYGVRAIGASSTGSNRGAFLAAAKNSFAQSRSSVKSTAQAAMKANGMVFVSIAMRGGGGTYTAAQVNAIKAVAVGYKNALNYAMTAYKQAMIAAAAASPNLTDAQFETIRTGIMGASGNEFSSYASYLPEGVSMADVTSLADSIAQAEQAISLATALVPDESATGSFTYSQISDIANKLIDTNALSSDNVDEDEMILTISADSVNGIVCDVARYVGSYQVKIGAAQLMINAQGDGLLNAVDINALTAPVVEDTQNEVKGKTLTDFYGYILDLAFRSNLDTELQLQTEAVDRIYSDENVSVMGGGSTVVFTHAGPMNETKIANYMSAVRVIFFNPDNGSIYGVGLMDDQPDIIRYGADGSRLLADDASEDVSETIVTARLIFVPGTDALDAQGQQTEEGGEAATYTTGPIFALEDSVPKKLSVLFFMDGNILDNQKSINASNAGTMQLNLQFSSTVGLSAMLDNELITGTASQPMTSEETP